MNPVDAHALLPILSAFCLTAALIGLMLRVPRWLPLDAPNERSLHVRPVPRVGGIAIMTAVTLALVWLRWHPLLLGCAVGLVIVSFLDDRAGLSTAIRLAAHLLAAITFVIWQAFPVPWWISAMFVLAIVWMTNLFNFMDGSDGLAGGMALFGFGTYALAAWWQGDDALASAGAVLAAASGAFLLFNFHPARVFMGDAGSIPLGFLAAALGLVGWHGERWPLWFPIVVFAPFVVDATVTLTRRLLRSERIWHAHRSHYYQRLVQLGWGHARTARAEYALMAVFAGLGLVALRAPAATQAIVLVIGGLLIAVLAALVDRAWARRDAVATPPGGGHSG